MLMNAYRTTIIIIYSSIQSHPQHSRRYRHIYYYMDHDQHETGGFVGGTSAVLDNRRTLDTTLTSILPTNIENDFRSPTLYYIHY